MKDMLIAIPADCDEDDRSYLALNGYSRREGVGDHQLNL
jgi:hypothetical protein